MATERPKSGLNSLVEANIRTNTNKEITAKKTRDVLLDIIESVALMLEVPVFSGEIKSSSLTFLTAVKNFYAGLGQTLTDTELVSSIEATAAAIYALDQQLRALITTSNYGIKYIWADAAARAAQVGMTTNEQGLQEDTRKVYKYNGATWDAFYDLDAINYTALDARYALIAHNHNGTYAPLVHTHDFQALLANHYHTKIYYITGNVAFESQTNYDFGLSGYLIGQTWTQTGNKSISAIKVSTEGLAYAPQIVNLYIKENGFLLIFAQEDITIAADSVTTIQLTDLVPITSGNDYQIELYTADESNFVLNGKTVGTGGKSIINGVTDANYDMYFEICEPTYNKVECDATNVKVTGELDMGDEKITNLHPPDNDTDAATKKYVDDNSTGGALMLTGGTMAGDISMDDTYTITNVVDPSNAQDVATKNYVDTNVPDIQSAEYSVKGNPTTPADDMTDISLATNTVLGRLSSTVEDIPLQSVLTGTVTLVAGTAQVADASITTNSIVLFSASSTGDYDGVITYTLASETCDFESTDATDTVKISYMIIII